MYIKSEKDAGSSFSLFLPLYNLVHISDREKSESYDVIAGEGTILVIDDEEFIVSVIDEILTIGGYKVLTAHSSDEAMKNYGDSLGVNDFIQKPFTARQLTEKIAQLIQSS
jgi:DNA-binding response OmpR family regulator